MTTSPPSRLDRIEALLEAIAQRQDRTSQLIEETQKIVDSNARSIQAEADAGAEARRNFRQMTRDLMARNFENLTQHEEFREAMEEFREAMNEFRKWIRKQGE